MGKKLAIKGHATRGKEVIELLEMLGGKNIEGYIGIEHDEIYAIEDGYIIQVYDWNDCLILSLEEFFEKYPFKVGDIVILDGIACTITWMCWECNNIYYYVESKVIKKKVTTEELKPYKETNIDGDNYCETLETKVFGYKVGDIIFTNNTGWIRITNKLWDCYAEEHVYEGIGIINEHEYKDIRHHNVTGKIELGHLKYCKDVDDIRYVNSITDDIMINQITNKVSVIKLKPDVCDNKIELQLGNYEIVVSDGKTYAILKKPTYPKTYAECCKVLDTEETYLGIDGHKGNLLIRFQRLLICRDAYWKIAGEEMGLGKPWDATYGCGEWGYWLGYSIIENKIFLQDSRILVNHTWVFPSAEMRDAFYENFKDLIEHCKELL